MTSEEPSMVASTMVVTEAKTTSEEIMSPPANNSVTISAWMKLDKEYSNTQADRSGMLAAASQMKLQTKLPSIYLGG